MTYVPFFFVIPRYIRYIRYIRCIRYIRYICYIRMQRYRFNFQYPLRTLNLLFCHMPSFLREHFDGGNVVKSIFLVPS